MTPELPLNIDSTMISCFRSCPKKFYEEFVLGLRPSAVSIDLHAGACFASALENVYRGVYTEKLDQNRALLRAFALYMDQWGDPEITKDTPKSRERVWEAVEEYFRTWGVLTDPVQPYILASGEPSYEFTFAIPLEPANALFHFETGASGNPLVREGHAVKVKADESNSFPQHPSGTPFFYSGRLDMLGRWGEKIVCRDEKTTTSIGASWESQWDLRSQFMGYVWACQQSGLDVDTVCVRGVGILKTKFTMVDAFKSFPKHKIDRWYEQLRRDLWRIRRCWDEGYWDYNFADACSSYGGCVFREICGSPEPDRWRKSFTVRRWNPTVKNPVAEPVEPTA